MYLAKVRKQMEEQDMKEVQSKADKRSESARAGSQQQVKRGGLADLAISIGGRRSSSSSRDGFQPEELPDGAFVSPKHTPTQMRPEEMTIIRPAEYIGSFSVCGVDEDTRALQVETQLQSLQTVQQGRPVELEINLEGVKVFNTEDQTVLMYHELKRISYAACDPQHHQFSFLAREKHLNIQYCHTFRTTAPQQAEELNVIMGDAFKMAYANQRDTLPTFHELIEAQIVQQQARFREIERQAHVELQRKLAEIARPTPFSQQAIQRMEQRKVPAEEAEPELLGGKNKLWAKHAVDQAHHRHSQYDSESDPSKPGPDPSVGLASDPGVFRPAMMGRRKAIGQDTLQHPALNDLSEVSSVTSSNNSNVHALQHPALSDLSEVTSVTSINNSTVRALQHPALSDLSEVTSVTSINNSTVRALQHPALSDLSEVTSVTSTNNSAVRALRDSSRHKSAPEESRGFGASMPENHQGVSPPVREDRGPRTDRQGRVWPDRREGSPGKSVLDRCFVRSHSDSLAAQRATVSPEGEDLSSDAEQARASSSSPSGADNRSHPTAPPPVSSPVSPPSSQPHSLGEDNEDEEDGHPPPCSSSSGAKQANSSPQKKTQLRPSSEGVAGGVVGRGGGGGKRHDNWQLVDMLGTAAESKSSSVAMETAQPVKVTPARVLRPPRRSPPPEPPPTPPPPIPDSPVCLRSPSQLLPSPLSEEEEEECVWPDLPPPGDLIIEEEEEREEEEEKSGGCVDSLEEEGDQSVECFTDDDDGGAEGGSDDHSESPPPPLRPDDSATSAWFSKGMMESSMSLDRREIEDPSLRQAAWYQPGIPREIALEILQQDVVGSFIIRDSATHLGCFALSVRVPETHSRSGVSHYVIAKNPRGFRLKGGSNKDFANLTSLVSYHTHTADNMPCRLRLLHNARNLTFLAAERDDSEEDAALQSAGSDDLPTSLEQLRL